MKKVETKYQVFVEGHHFPYLCIMPDMDRIQKGMIQKRILACVTYDNGRCALYYNEGNYPKEELQKAGYAIVSKLQKVEVYEKVSEIPFTN